MKETSCCIFLKKSNLKLLKVSARRGGFNEYHNLCFEQKYEKYQIFLSEKLPFLVIKFSVYLNRHVFVMVIRQDAFMLVNPITINNFASLYDGSSLEILSKSVGV